MCGKGREIRKQKGTHNRTQNASSVTEDHKYMNSEGKRQKKTRKCSVKRNERTVFSALKKLLPEATAPPPLRGERTMGKKRERKKMKKTVMGRQLVSRDIRTKASPSRTPRKGGREGWGVIKVVKIQSG